MAAIAPLLIVLFSAAVCAATGLAVHRARLDMKEARKANHAVPTVGRAVWPHVKFTAPGLIGTALLAALILQPVAGELSGLNALLANLTIPLWVAAVVLMSLWVQILAMKTAPTAVGLVLLGIFAVVVVGFSTSFLSAAILGPAAYVALSSADLSFVWPAPLPALVLLVVMHAGALWLVLRAKRPRGPRSAAVRAA